MAGTKEGGKRAAQTNTKRYGKDFYAKIGSVGGRNSTGTNTGFGVSSELARSAGSAGGTKSKIGRRFLYTKGGFDYYQVTKPSIRSNKVVGSIEKYPTKSKEQ